MSGGWKSSFSQRPNTERYKRSILGIATRSDRRLLGAPGLTSSNKKLIVTKCIASSNKCLTSSNKDATSNKKQ